MTIPQNITKEDLEQGAEKIIKEGIPNNAHSSTYDVFYKNKLLPPKLVVAYANIFRNGEELDRNTFEGGLNTECFKLLEANGFQIVKKGEKDSVYPLLLKFLEQAKTDSMQTAQYPKKLKGLDCKVSFGIGNQAKIPWISFLKPPHTTANGIYPVYLYFKSQDVLILAYGVSETNPPSINWDIDNVPTIKEFFKENEMGRPERYGASYLFKAYDVNDMPTADELDRDLDEIINTYKIIGDNVKKDIIIREAFDKKAFADDLKNAGLIFNTTLVTRFISSLITKPFVILSGLSGSGKTKLAQSFAEWISGNKSQYCMVPVGADWTNREPLLGYPNALQPDEYIMPDNGVLKLIIEAIDHPDLPYFLILDEMNLSHVERYFADFLSVMESKKSISLFSGDGQKDGVPSELCLPANLFIIGTVNIDETTYMFSPKVLDRANAIEFRVTSEEIEYYFEHRRELDLDKLTGLGANMAASFLEMAETKEFAEQDLKEVYKTMVGFFGQLKKSGAEFGYRSGGEIIRLIHQLSVIDPEMSMSGKMDIAIVQKLLPKLHGSRRKLCPVLATLGSFCVDSDIIKDVEKEVFPNEDFDLEMKGVKFPISLEKIARMYRGAIDNGFASFAEA